MSQSILAAESLSVSIGESLILDQLTFEIQPGTLTGIIGPNGSGKTTLLRTISGILDYRGKLVFLDQAINAWDSKALARHLSVLPQSQTISFDFNVWDYVLMGRLPHKGWLEADSSEDRLMVEQVLQELDLAGMEKRTIPSLSGGERQRVLLAQALVQDTAMLLLDEPTSHLDIYHQFDLLKRIRTLANEGKTVLVVFHDLAMAARFTDSLLVIHNGRLFAQGNTEEVLTSDLIKQVFRMSATLHHDSEEPPYIYFKDQA